MTDDTISASVSIDTGCTIVRTMLSTPAKNWGSECRAPRHKKQLRVENVFVAVGVQREDAHAGAELEVDNMHGRADADEDVGRAVSVRNGRKNDPTFEIEFGAGRIEQRIHIGDCRP